MNMNLAVEVLTKRNLKCLTWKCGKVTTYNFKIMADNSGLKKCV